MSNLIDRKKGIDDLTCLKKTWTKSVNKESQERIGDKWNFVTLTKQFRARVSLFSVQLFRHDARDIYFYSIFPAKALLIILSHIYFNRTFSLGYIYFILRFFFILLKLLNGNGSRSSEGGSDDGPRGHRLAIPRYLSPLLLFKIKIYP